MCKALRAGNPLLCRVSIYSLLKLELMDTNNTSDTNKANNTNETNKPNPAEKFAIRGDWNAQSKLLKEEFTQLTDADLEFESGKEHELLGRMATRLNMKHSEVIGIIKKGQPETI